MFGNCSRHRCSEALSKKDDSVWRDLGDLQSPLYKCNSICDESLLIRTPSGVAKATIVNSKDMDFVCTTRSQGTVCIGPPSLTNGSSIAMDYSESALIRSDRIWLTNS